MYAYIPMNPAQAKVGIAHFVVTGAVCQALDNDEMTTAFFDECMNRHQSGDWGEVDEDGKQVNEAALEFGDRLMSVYPLPQRIAGNDYLWVMSYGGLITDGEHRLFARTEVMFPSDY
jgi:hypothetical protein